MADEENNRQDFKEKGQKEQQEEQSADEGIKDSHGQPGINKERHDREAEKLNAQIANLESQTRGIRADCRMTTCTS